MTTTKLLITGMRDNCCREQIAEVLAALAGVKQVDVSLYRAVASVVHDRTCPAEEILRAIQKAGYSAAIRG